MKNACTVSDEGVDPGFQVRWGAFKKIAPSGGRCEKFWGISCEKSRFYAKKSYFFKFYCAQITGIKICSSIVLV
jgi:hypothetical protein